MPRLSRRSFLAASAALVAAPAVVTQAAEGEIVVIGAGAAGIAAARRLAAARRPVRVLEASNRIGGRCATDTKIFGVPFDLGAHLIHNPDANPVLAAAGAAGFNIDPVSRATSLRVGQRKAGDAELETFLAASLKARRAMTDLGKAKADFTADRLLPRDLGDWRQTMEFLLGPLATGRDLKDISAFEMARQPDRDDVFCRQGYGALLARVAAGLNVQLGSPVDAIYWGHNLAIDTPKGNMLVRAAIVTVSPEVLSSGDIDFIPPLPKRTFDAAQKLTLGSYDHVAFDLPGNPLGLQRDDIVYEQAMGKRTAALIGNVGGSSLHMVEIAGSFGKELAKTGDTALVAFATDWLVSLFGSGVKNKIKRSHATNWTADPLTRGAMYAPAIGDGEARKILLEPLGDKVWFAGEALSDTQWGTVAGAWDSGTRAAEALLRRGGGPVDDGQSVYRRKRKH